MRGGLGRVRPLVPSTSQRLHRGPRSVPKAIKPKGPTRSRRPTESQGPTGHIGPRGSQGPTRAKGPKGPTRYIPPHPMQTCGGQSASLQTDKHSMKASATYATKVDSTMAGASPIKLGVPTSTHEVPRGPTPTRLSPWTTH